MAQQTQGEILRVPDDFEIIQAGIDAAEDGDTVLVQPSEYVENISFEGKAITVASLILTTGDPAYIDSTIIDGNREGSVVRFNNNEDENSILRGFTITNGLTHGNNHGGGICCDPRRGFSSPTLTELLVTDNEASAYGGGIYLKSGTASITNCTISRNRAQIEAGITMWTGSPVLRNVMICENEASTAGGGVHGEAIGVYQFDEVSIVNNISHRWAGGVYIFYSHGVGIMRNVTIVNNEAEEYGGIWLSCGGEEGGRAALSLWNSIVYGNSGSEITINGIENQQESFLSVSCSDLEDGQDDIELRNEFVEIEWNDGNIDEDPLFVDPDNGDYHLTEDYPCIDAGDPESREDPDGTRADMGAFFFNQEELLHELIIPFNEGWNLISINLVPPEEMWEHEEGPDIIRMTNQLRIDEDNHHIILMKNEVGQFYAPEHDFINIPFWNLAEGYQVKVDDDVEAVWTGEKIPADRDIPLREGWNIIAYLPTYELDARAPDFYVLSLIIDHVMFVKDRLGHFMAPEHEFSNMAPWYETQGYQVKVEKM